MPGATKVEELDRPLLEVSRVTIFDPEGISCESCLRPGENGDWSAAKRSWFTTSNRKSLEKEACSTLLTGPAAVPGCSVV